MNKSIKINNIDKTADFLIVSLKIIFFTLESLLQSLYQTQEDNYVLHQR